MLAQELFMQRTRFAAAALVLLTAASATAQTTVAGDWDVTIQTMQGPNTVRVTFKQDGEKVSGVLKSRMGEMPFEGGTLTGSDLKFSFTVPVQGQTLEITMTGKVEAAAITGKANFGGFGEGDWTAKRAEAETAAAPATTTAPAETTSTTTTTATSVNGKWDVIVKTQMGDLPVTADLTETAGKVSGTLVGPAGPVEVTGTIEGATLKLSFTAPTPQGDIPITMTGDVNGDAIAGKAEFGGMGQAEWTAKRAPKQ
jgi:hypothetical protein